MRFVATWIVKTTINKTTNFINMKKASTIPKQLPYCHKVLFENFLNNTDDQELALKRFKNKDIDFHPYRILMQDYTGVPAILDLVATSIKAKKSLSMKTKVDLVIDHSIKANFDNVTDNQNTEFLENHERYQFLKWADKNIENLTVVPPGHGICHQVNLEYLANVVIEKEGNIFFDTLLGTDSHTPMINALGVMGFGVGGIEAESCMLGLPLSMELPDVICCKLHNKLTEGVTSTDLVLHITKKLREYDLVGKMVEFDGDGIESLTIEDRATIANMAPEYGATTGFFPIDDKTIDYLSLTGRKNLDLVKTHAKKTGLWRNDDEKDYHKIINIDLSCVSTCISGPNQPHSTITLKELSKTLKSLQYSQDTFQDQSIALAAITSCTNTSNPKSIITAALLAKNAVEKNIKPYDFTKCSFAPGSKVVSKYLNDFGLSHYLDELDFKTVGYGCTTCIGNSGDLSVDIKQAIEKDNLDVAAVLSGNRNFTGRVNPDTKSAWLMSPALVIAYALSGNMKIDLTTMPIQTINGNEIYLKDLWPSEKEINKYLSKINQNMFIDTYKHIKTGPYQWESLTIKDEPINKNSSYLKLPNFFDRDFNNNISAKVFAVFGDNVSTDHISPASKIKSDSDAGKYLTQIGVKDNFNTFGARRGNHEVMKRGTFSNPRIKNLLASKEGGFGFIGDKEVTFFEMYEHDKNQDFVVFAGDNYGIGSSRDYAAKGPGLLNIKAIFAKSFERIHRSNLIGMGILPILIKNDVNVTKDSHINIKLDTLKPKQVISYFINEKKHTASIAINTKMELDVYMQGGILPYALQALKS